MTYDMTTQAQVRRAFWDEHYPDGRPARFRGKSQNELPCDVRMTWCDYVEHLARSGRISEKLASRVTL